MFLMIFYYCKVYWIWEQNESGVTDIINISQAIEMPHIAMNVRFIT